MVPDWVDWSTFFTTLAGLGVALAFLIFVPLGKDFKLWAEYPLGRLVLFRNLMHFLIPCFFTLIVTIPPHNWHVAALICASVGSLIIGQYRKLSKRPSNSATSLFETRQGEDFKYSRFVYAGFVVFTLLDWVHHDASNLILIAMLLSSLLAAGALDTWNLYMRPPQLAKDNGNSNTVLAEKPTASQLEKSDNEVETENSIARTKSKGK